MTSLGTGCGTLGTNTLSVKADTQNLWNFLTDNEALLTDGLIPPVNTVLTLA